MQSKTDTTKFEMNISADRIKSAIIEKEHTLNILNSLPDSQLQPINHIQIGAVAEIQKDNKE